MFFIQLLIRLVVISVCNLVPSQPDLDEPGALLLSFLAFALSTLVVLVGIVAEKSWKIANNGREVRAMVEVVEMHACCGKVVLCRVAMSAMVVFCRDVLVASWEFDV